MWIPHSLAARNAVPSHAPSAPRAERCRDSSPVGDAACSHHRSGIRCVHDLRHQRHGGYTTCVSPRLGALRHHDIDPGIHLSLGISNASGEAHHYDALLPRLWHHPRGVAEGGGEHSHVLFQNHVYLAPGQRDAGFLWLRRRLDPVQSELGHQRIDELGVSRILSTDSLDFRFLLSRPAVRLDLPCDDGEKQIDAEGLVRQLAHPADALSQLIYLDARPTHDAETARLRHGGDELGRRPLSAHACQADRILDLEYLAESRAQDRTGHGTPPSIAMGV